MNGQNKIFFKKSWSSKILLPWFKLLRLNAVGFNGEDGGDGRANEDALPADVAALEDSREPNISDGENNLDEPVTFAWAAKDVKNGDIIDGIVDVAVNEGCNEPKGDLKSPKFSFFISSFIKSWSSGWSSGSESSRSALSSTSSSESSRSSIVGPLIESRWLLNDGGIPSPLSCNNFNFAAASS